MVRVVQVSDTHLSPRTPEATDNWRAVVRHLNADPPDLVVHTGDVTLDGAHDEADLQFARRLLDEVEAPQVVVPGNHDLGDVAPTAMPIDEERRRRYVDLFDDGFWSRPCGAWRLVGVDIQTLLSGLADTEERWTWLGRELGRPDPTVLFLHRPLAPLEATDEDVAIRYVGAPHRHRLQGLLAGSTVRVLASGHVHQFRTGRTGSTHGIDHVWAPSTWACLPDDVQPVLGDKVVGVVEHVLEAEATSRVVVPDGVAQHTIGVDIPVPYDH